MEQLLGPQDKITLLLDLPSEYSFIKDNELVPVVA